MLEFILLVVTVAVMYYIYSRRKFQLQMSIREGLQISAVDEEEQQQETQVEEGEGEGEEEKSETNVEIEAETVEEKADEVDKTTTADSVMEEDKQE